MKLAFIVQRYGREILGGSETLARQLAERLSRRHDISVLTTTAKDYITWKNEYEPGEEKHRGVRIIRFPVEGERDIEDFNKFSEEIYRGNPTREQELEWLQRQGPVCPELVEYLKKEHERFDLLVFFTYLYYPTYYGLQVAPEKSVLVPTAHDEPPLKLGIFKEMFQLPSSFLFNSEAEELLVLERFPVHKKMRETIGMGMELLDQPDASVFRKAHNISGKYFLYAGRIDGGKGLEELFRYFSFFKEEHPATGNLKLILIGKLGMKLPSDKSIRYIGFVDEAEKLSAMAGAVAVLQPSKMESLSIVTLEAFSVGSPVVANAASRVLVDHCRKSNAGFYYQNFEEFEEILGLLLTDRNLVRSLGKNGQRYIKENYGWQNLISKYELALRASARPVKEAKNVRRRERDESKKEVEESAARERDRDRERERERDLERPPEHEPAPVEVQTTGEAVSETEDPDATVRGEEVTQESRPPAKPEHRGRDDRGERRERTEATAKAASEERVASESPESTGGEPETEEEEAEKTEEPVPEDVAHLPSFFQSAIPSRKHEPLPEPEPKSAERTPEPPPPPPPPDGELPEFFRPKPKSTTEPKPESESAPPSDEAESKDASASE